jgi:transposase InsO family protein
MIEAIHQSTGHSVRCICSCLQVPRSSYYHAASPTPTQRSDQMLGAQIEEIFTRHRRRYGHRRVRQELTDQGVLCAAHRVRRLMAQRGLKALQPRHYLPRTSDGRADKPSDNLLVDQPLPAKPNEVWTGDITFIPCSGGWLYLAVVMDLYSRKIVGWALADNLRTPLVVAALQQALGSRRRASGAIFHSDRGSQYGSIAYRQMLKQAGLRQSMSARANPYHNAWTESFIATLKTEMLQGRCFVDHKHARLELFTYIESYYNTQRKHSALHYSSPAKFESLLSNSN